MRQLIDPSLRDLLDMVKQEVFLQLNCHAVGTVKSFDPVKQTVTASINYKKTFLEKNEDTGDFEERYYDYPILVDMPAIILGGGSVALTMPIQADDECLIFFNDRDIANWFNGTNGTAPATDLFHAISEGICLVGLRNANRSIDSYDGTRALMTNGNVKLGVNPDTNKLTAQNDTKSLKDLLTELIAQIKLITVSGVDSHGDTVTCGPPLNSAAFDTIATEVGGLLE